MVLKIATGALFSIMASLESLSSMVAASLWPVIFATTLNHNMRSGTAYYILSSIIFIMIPLARYVCAGYNAIL